MKRKTISAFTVVLTLSFLFFTAAFVWGTVPVKAEDPLPNDTSACNCVAPETNAVTVNYSGKPTLRYGIQAYAGVTGPAWIVGNTAGWADLGKGSHVIGSNYGDDRSGLNLTFKVNSSVAERAYLWLYVEGNPATLGVSSISVNDGEAEEVNVASAKKHGAYDSHDAAIIPVDLNEGLNVIRYVTGENYTGWYHTFAFSPYADAISAHADYKKVYSVAPFAESTGDMSVNANGIGLNAFDDPSDYGKTGSVTYKVFAETAGEYNVGFFVMAGNPLANRAKITLNGVTVMFGEKEYCSFNTVAGWGGDSWNTFPLALSEGLNTLKIENSLTYVNANKTEELEAGTEGGVYVSNWWMHQLCFERIPQTRLEVDTDNAKLYYNPGRTFSAEGLAVYYVVDEERTLLSFDEYTVSEPNLSSPGSKVVTVTKNGEDMSAEFFVTVGTEGVDFEGQTIDFDGVDTGLLSFYRYAEIKGEGVGDCEGRLFYMFYEKPTDGGGYIFGSNGVGSFENRQMTLTLHINNTGESGIYHVKTYHAANGYTYNHAYITVNDSDTEYVNICSPERADSPYVPYVFEAELNSGENEIEIKLQDAYSAWLADFRIEAIDTSLKEYYSAFEGARGGTGYIDTADMTWKGRGERSLTYRVLIDEEGKYIFTFDCGKQDGKSFVFTDNGVETAVEVSAAGNTRIMKQLSSGEHKLTLSADSDDGNFGLKGFSVERFVAPDSIYADTSEMNTVLENGASLNVAKLKVYAVFDNTETELDPSEYELIYPAGFSSTVAGVYDITVRLVYDEDVTTTFEITVKQAKEVVSLELNTDNVTKVLTLGDALNTSDMIVKAVFGDDTKTTLTEREYTVSIDERYISETGEYTVRVTLNSDETIFAEFLINVVGEEPPVQSEKDGCGGCGGALGGAGMLALAAMAFMLFAFKKK